VALPVQATLREAVDTLRTHQVQAGCIFEPSPDTGRKMLRGVLTMDAIEKHALAKLL